MFLKVSYQCLFLQKNFHEILFENCATNCNCQISNYIRIPSTFYRIQRRTSVVNCRLVSKSLCGLLLYVLRVRQLLFTISPITIRQRSMSSRNAKIHRPFIVTRSVVENKIKKSVILLSTTAQPIPKIPP